jgi:hypothetical protein
MKQTMDRLVRYLVACAKAVERSADEILAADPSQGGYAHENYRYGAHVLLVLYKHQHPRNPCFGKAETLDLCFRLSDDWLTRWEETGCGFAEWPPLMVGRGLDLLGDELDPDRRARWERFLAWFVEQDLAKPFFFTSPNHEAWRLAVTALASRVLRRPEWLDLARFQTKQLIRYQTPEGFWEEGRHHGPSMKYNALQLGALAVTAEETGDEYIRAAAARLADFMARWAFPDGVTVGAFDGRQSTSPGYFGRVVPGLELAESGPAHLDRILQFWEEAGWLDDPTAVGPSNWYAHFGMPFPAESLVYYAGRLPTERTETGPLPMDRDGAALENHTALFDSVLRRQGPWCVAVSGQLSDVPKDTLFIYRLERQNRIELWHERASVVLGGGHNLVTAEHPLYNVWVDSGYRGDRGETYAGMEKGKLGGMARTLRRAKYYPRAAATGIEGGVTRLELDTAHAAVRFEIDPAGDAAVLRYGFEQMGAVELRIALPMVLWRGARCLVDGAALDGPHEQQAASVVPVQNEVAVECPLFGTRTTLAVPGEGAARVRFPLWPMRHYDRPFQTFEPGEEHFGSFFTIAQVEALLRDPPRTGSGEWMLTVQDIPGR